MQLEEIRNSQGLRVRQLTDPQASATQHPTLLYLACSAKESLTGEPICQPARAAAEQGCRVISIDLPDHAEGVPLDTALSQWVDHFRAGRDPFEPWLSQCEEWIRSSIGSTPFALMGLSRGGFLSGYLASRIPTARVIVLFAPLLSWEASYNFQEVAKLGAIPEKYDLFKRADQFRHTALRIYIGNLDQRVGVRPSFEFIEAIAADQHAARIVPVPCELVIRPSLGYLGHGTAPETFVEGARWAAAHLQSH